MKIYYKDNVFMVRTFEGTPAAVMRKKDILPTIVEQFRMLKKLKSLFPHRAIDFNFAPVDDYFCIRLKQ